MAGTRCRFHGCTKTAMTDKYDGYCYVHRMHASNAFQLSPGNVLTNSEIMMMRTPPTISGSASDLVGYRSDVVSRSVNIDQEDAKNIMRSGKTMSAQHGDMRIPKVADSADRPAEKMKDTMIEEGMDPNRLSLEEFRGVNRMTMSGKVNSASRATQQVVVLDRDTDREVIIDPAISRFAPMKDATNEVDDELPSGLTPFGDSPWVGSREEYSSGSFLWWNSSQRQDW